MVQRKGGFRRKTRFKLQKSNREKGKVSITNYLQEFKDGDQVQLHAEPAIQKGMYFPRFHGKVGIILGKKGKCYSIKIKENSAEKTVVVHPVHLKRL